MLPSLLYYAMVHLCHNKRTHEKRIQELEVNLVLLKYYRIILNQENVASAVNQWWCFNLLNYFDSDLWYALHSTMFPCAINLRTK